MARSVADPLFRCLIIAALLLSFVPAPLPAAAASFYRPGGQAQEPAGSPAPFDLPPATTKPLATPAPLTGTTTALPPDPTGSKPPGQNLPGQPPGPVPPPAALFLPTTRPSPTPEAPPLFAPPPSLQAVRPAQAGSLFLPLVINSAAAPLAATASGNNLITDAGFEAEPTAWAGWTVTPAPGRSFPATSFLRETWGPAAGYSGKGYAISNLACGVGTPART
jgi:hypothetical protein